MPTTTAHQVGTQVTSKLKATCGKLAQLLEGLEGKKIDAEQDVLETYDSSLLYGHVALGLRIRGAIGGGTVGAVLLLVEVIAAAGSIAIYLDAMATKRRHEPTWVVIVQALIAAFFCLDYVLKVFSAPLRTAYIFSTNGVIDLLSLLPLIFVFTSAVNGFIPQLFMLIRIFRVVPYVFKIGLVRSSIGQQLLQLVALLLGLVLSFAILFQWVENRRRFNCRTQSEECLTYFESMYFIIVTASTVGYGDIYPETNLGRMVVIVFIVIAITVVPLQLAQILELSSRRPYGGRFRARDALGSRYIIVSGNISHSTIQPLLAEFFHPHHGKDESACPLRIVVMAPYKPSFDLKSLLGLYGGCVAFLEGSPLRKGDLKRVSAGAASAIYLVADPNAEGPDSEDAAQVVRALSVQRFCAAHAHARGRPRIVVQMSAPHGPHKHVWDTDSPHKIEVICTEELRFQMLARSCSVRGLSTLVANLVASAPLLTERAQAAARKHKPWMNEYYQGMLNEIFPVLLPPCFLGNGFRFQQVAEFVYLYSGCILFALDTKMSSGGAGGSRTCRLFPAGHVVEDGDVGLVLARDLRQAQRISQITPKDEKGRWHWCNWQKKAIGDTRAFQNPRGVAVEGQEQTPAGVIVEGCEARVAEAVVEGHEGRAGERMVEGHERRPPEGSGEGDGGAGEGLATRLWGSAAAGMVNGHWGSAAAFGVSRPADLAKERGPREGGVARPKDVPGEQAGMGDSPSAVVATLLQWPPAERASCLSAALLDHQQEKILASLAARTLTSATGLGGQRHILVCLQSLWPPGLSSLVAQLRPPPPWRRGPPLLFLCPVPPSAQEWGRLGLFEEVSYIKGAAHVEGDLLRAGALQADTVLLVAERHPEGKGAEGGDEGLLAARESDVKNVTAAAILEAALGSGGPGRAVPQVLVELQHSDAFQYLRPHQHLDEAGLPRLLYERNHSSIYRFAPPFQSGKAFTPMYLNYMLPAIFYNRSMGTIIHQMVTCDVAEPSAGHGSNGQGGLLQTMDVPESYDRVLFRDLFVGLLREGTLALGLLRARGAEESPAEKAPADYVYTNPCDSAICHKCDLVYVIVLLD